MPMQLTSYGLMGLGLVASAGLCWLQWRILKRLVGRPNEWVAANVIGAAVGTPLTVRLLLNELTQAGLPSAAVLPLGLGLLLALLLGGALWVAAVAWATKPR
jgi:hypothetical protein